MIGWQVFLNPIEMGSGYVWLVLPLCAVLAIVYKSIRVQHLGRLPLAILELWGYMLGGFVVVGLAFWLLSEYAGCSPH